MSTYLHPIDTLEGIPRDSIRNITWEDIHRACHLHGKKKYHLVASAELVNLHLPPHNHVVAAAALQQRPT